MEFITLKQALKLYKISMAEFNRFKNDSIHPCRCSECGFISEAEPDAEGYDCEECDGEGTVNAIMIEMGIM